jgi:hypothetical protein
VNAVAISTTLRRLRAPSSSTRRKRTWSRPSRMCSAPISTKRPAEESIPDCSATSSVWSRSNTNCPLASPSSKSAMLACRLRTSSAIEKSS